MPVGLQLIGNYFGEAKLLNAAHRFQQATDFHLSSRTGASEKRKRDCVKLINGYEVVIGFETHTQLATNSKIFSRASTAFGAEPNTQACAVDLALPGTLPVMNKGAVERAIRSAWRGLDCAAKHLRAQELLLPRPAQGLPDQPVRDPRGARRPSQLLLATAEEDRAPGARPPGGRRRQVLHDDFIGQSGIDLNRAGTPLLEIVTEPDMRSTAEAVAYAKAAQDRHLDRHLRRQHAGRLLPLRRQRVGAQARPAASAPAARSRTSTASASCSRPSTTSPGRSTRSRTAAIQQATVLFDPDTARPAPCAARKTPDYRYFPDPDLLPLVIAAPVGRA
jgi:aspartyl-tRNA(Asn)/glutamyl-tRNA(Gln) amidotransferase subunit B